MSKRLSKCTAAFDYFGKALTVLSVITGGISIASLITVIGAPKQVASASFSFSFSVTTKLIKKLLKTIQNKRQHRRNIIR